MRVSDEELMIRCRRDEMSHNDLINGVKDYLNSRFNLSIGVLTSDETVKILLAQGVRSNTAENLRALIRKLEDAVYTGKGHEKTDMAKGLHSVVKEIEKETR